MTVTEKVKPLGEEFTDRILVDNVRKSILLSIHKDYFDTLKYEYQKMKYTLVHATQFENTNEMTVLFMYDGDK